MIEIQSTFYKLPRLGTAERWRASAPPGFEFTVKAWQLITHEPSSPTYRRLGQKIESSKLGRYGSFRFTAEVRGAWDRTAAFARALGASTVVFQCPASFGPSQENLARLRSFFSRADRHGLRFVWEPRRRPVLPPPRDHRLRIPIHRRGLAEAPGMGCERRRRGSWKL